MRNPLKPMLELLKEAGQERLAFQLRIQLGEPTVAALVREGLLEEGARAEHFPCRKNLSHCHRTVVRYAGPGPFDFAAVPPESASSSQMRCCEILLLIDNDLRTLRICEPRLFRRIAAWLPFKMEAGSFGYSSDDLTRLGWLESPVHERPVLFARRIATRQTLAALERIEGRDAALVLAPTRVQELPDVLLERYSGPSPVRLLFIEDYLHVRETQVRFRGLPADLGAWGAGAGAVSQNAGRGGCLACTRDGLVTVSPAEYAQILAGRHEYDLLVNLTAPVRDRYAGTMRDASVVQEFELSPAQTTLLLALIRANGRALAVVKLQELFVLEKDLADEMDDLRRRWERPSGRASVVHLHRNQAGELTHVSFRPPPNFYFAILLPLDFRDEAGADLEADSN